MNCPYQIEIPDRVPVGDRFHCLHRFYITVSTYYSYLFSVIPVPSVVPNFFIRLKVFDLPNLLC